MRKSNQIAMLLLTLFFGCSRTYVYENSYLEKMARQFNYEWGGVRISRVHLKGVDTEDQVKLQYLGGELRIELKLPDGETTYVRTKTIENELVVRQTADYDRLVLSLEKFDWGLYGALYDLMPHSQKSFLQNMIKLRAESFVNVDTNPRETDFMFSAGRSTHWDPRLRSKLNKNAIPEIGRMLDTLHIENWVGEMSMIECMGEHSILRFWDPSDCLQMRIYVGRTEGKRAMALWERFGRTRQIVKFSGSLTKRRWRDDGIIAGWHDTHWFELGRGGYNYDDESSSYFEVEVRGSSQYEIVQVLGMYRDLEVDTFTDAIDLVRSETNGSFVTLD